MTIRFETHNLDISLEKPTFLFPVQDRGHHPNVSGGRAVTTRVRKEPHGTIIEIHQASALDKRIIELARSFLLFGISKMEALPTAEGIIDSFFRKVGLLPGERADFEFPLSWREMGKWHLNAINNRIVRIGIARSTTEDGEPSLKILFDSNISEQDIRIIEMARRLRESDPNIEDPIGRVTAN